MAHGLNFLLCASEKLIYVFILMSSSHHEMSNIWPFHPAICLSGQGSRFKTKSKIWSSYRIFKKLSSQKYGQPYGVHYDSRANTQQGASAAHALQSMRQVKPPGVTQVKKHGVLHTYSCTHGHKKPTCTCNLC